MAPNPTRLNARALSSPVELVDVNGNVILTVAVDGKLTLGPTGGAVGFYGSAPIALQTGVAVTAGGIHAALVALNLITA